MLDRPAASRTHYLGQRQWPGLVVGQVGARSCAAGGVRSRAGTAGWG